MNIDIREYLRINPISVHDSTLSGDGKDCFLLFQGENYEVQTQASIFRTIYQNIFQNLIDENIKFRAYIDDDGKVKWQEGTHLADGQFPQFVRREEWEAFRDSFDQELYGLESDVRQRLSSIVDSGVLDYRGAVEIQTALSSRFNDLYERFKYGVGQIWCMEDGIALPKGQDWVEIESPAEHVHPDTRAEAMTFPFTTKRGGGQLAGEFFAGSKFMTSNGLMGDVAVGTIMDIVENEVMDSDDGLTCPLHGQNVLDWRDRRRTHNNIPPSTNVWVRYDSEGTTRSASARKEVSNGRRWMANASSPREECAVEMEYGSDLVPNLSEYTLDDLTKHDYLLRMGLSSNGEVNLMKQKVKVLLDIFSNDAGNRLKMSDDGRTYSMSEILRPLLDSELVVKSDEFYPCMIEFERRMDRIDSIIQQISDAIVNGRTPRTYTGRVIISATDDTEQKVIQHYGGKAWRRMTNFLRGVEAGDPELGRKLGEAYVELRQSNVPLHTHDVKKEEGQEDYWVVRDRGGRDTTMINQNRNPDLETACQTRNVQMEYQISPLEEGVRNSIVLPHDNMPPYMDVYIWECTDAGEDAIWRIFYDMGGVSGAMLAPETPRTYTKRDEPFYPEDPDYVPGWEFIGWTPACIPPNHEGDFTFRANWKSAMTEYSIEYLNQPSSQDLPSYSTFPKHTYTSEDPEYYPPTPPKTDGWKFLNWQPPSIPHGSSGNKRMVACWAEASSDADFRVLTFLDVSGIVVKTVVVDNGHVMKPSDIPEYEVDDRFRFNGWFNVADHSQLNSGLQIWKDYAFSAECDQLIYEIHYDVGTEDSTLPSDAVSQYDVRSLPLDLPVPSKVSMIDFKGWTPKNTSGTLMTSIPKGTTGDLYLLGVWDDADTCKVEFNLGYRDEPYFISRQEKSQPLQIPSDDPARNGYEFVGWYTAAEGGTPISGQDIVVEQDSVYYAQWNANTYSIFYTMNGHGEQPEQAKTRYTPEDPDYTIPPPRGVQGYAFDSWTPSIIPQGSYGDKTVTAGWTANDCHISFVYHDDATPTRTVTVKYDEPLGELDSPEKKDYVFNGWFTAETDGEQVTSSTIVKGNATYHGQWRRATYAITFNPSGGTCSETTRNVKAGDPYGTLPTASKHGYNFNGWWTDAAAGDKATTTMIPSDDTVLYAHWAGKTYSISSIPYTESTRDGGYTVSATSTLFSNVQGGGRFNLQLKDIQVKHKGGEVDHNVFLRLFAVNAAKTSQQMEISCAPEITYKNGYGRVYAATLIVGTSRIQTTAIIGASSAVTVGPFTLKFNNINLPYANTILKIMVYTPDNEDKNHACKGGILYANGSATLTRI